MDSKIISLEDALKDPQLNVDPRYGIFPNANEIRVLYHNDVLCLESFHLVYYHIFELNAKFYGKTEDEVIDSIKKHGLLLDYAQTAEVRWRYVDKKKEETAFYCLLGKREKPRIWLGLTPRTEGMMERAFGLVRYGLPLNDYRVMRAIRGSDFACFEEQIPKEWMIDVKRLKT